MDGLWWRIPSRNGWLGGTPILGNLQMTIMTLMTRTTQPASSAAWWSPFDRADPSQGDRSCDPPRFHMSSGSWCFMKYAALRYPILTREDHNPSVGQSYSRALSRARVKGRHRDWMKIRSIIVNQWSFLIEHIITYHQKNRNSWIIWNWTKKMKTNQHPNWWYPRSIHRLLGLLRRACVPSQETPCDIGKLDASRLETGSQLVSGSGFGISCDQKQ